MGLRNLAMGGLVALLAGCSPTEEPKPAAAVQAPAKKQYAEPWKPYQEISSIDKAVVACTNSAPEIPDMIKADVMEIRGLTQDVQYFVIEPKEAKALDIEEGAYALYQKGKRVEKGKLKDLSKFSMWVEIEYHFGGKNHVPERCSERLKIGDMAPQFTATTLDGKKVSLTDYKGKPVLLDFWATWCAPCVASTRQKIKLYEAYKSEIEFLGVSLDKDRQAVEEYVNATNFPYSQICDGVEADSSKGAIAKSYQVIILPQKYLIGGDGKIAAQWKNVTFEEEVEKIKEIIKK
jgi:peroxiredoxin